MATPIKVNRIGLEPQIYKGGKTTLCAGCGHNAISERIIEAFYEMGVDPKQVDQTVGHRVLEQEPGVFSRRVSRVQRGARAHAVGRHRRHAREPEAHRHRRERRRRHGCDRHRPVRPPDAAQPADHLHHRGQRLLRAHERAVLADGRSRVEAEERCGQRPAADRHLCAGDSTRRHVRRAVVFGRQETAALRC